MEEEDGAENQQRRRADRSHDLEEDPDVVDGADRTDVAEASTLDAEMRLVSRGVGLSITSEAVGLWYKRPGVTFVPILDLAPCSVSLAWWPQDTALVAGLAAVVNEVRARIAAS
jgi:hypothetical protein